MKTLAILIRNLALDLRYGSLLRVATLGFVFVFLFYPVIQGLVLDWSTHYEYSHGFLIPLLSGYLIWCRRRELQECSGETSLAGFGILLFGLTFYVLGLSGQEEFVQRLSLPVTLAGLVYFLAGRRITKISLFPIGYLFLMIPIPFTLYKAIALELRLLDAKLVASWSSFLGVPVFREGYLIYLPNITLEVADGCSGVLSILALVALGTFYINQIELPMGGKSLLWGLLIPVSVLANVVRIVTIVFLVHYSGEWVLQTTFHKLSGTFNFLLGFMTIALVGFMLKRILLPGEVEK